MLIASTQTPKENVAYVIGKFQEHFPLSCDDFGGDAAVQKKFGDKIASFTSKKGGPDAHAFMDYVTGKDMSGYIQAIKIKPTKSKPMSFERLNMVIMTIVKYFESVMVTQKQEDHKNSIDCLNKWIQTI